MAFVESTIGHDHTLGSRAALMMHSPAVNEADYEVLNINSLLHHGIFLLRKRSLEKQVICNSSIKSTPNICMRIRSEDPAGNSILKIPFVLRYFLTCLTL
ncbi:hypothetical protein TNCV_2396931 [Trichonephila clavipes]|uniref:Uncharacterized protein n=1 Tax=Trichonephila clavipes TaxID=2585209 RepID=A0A8X6SW35_TRICX|nr:hypothetical protein TNCV_2396931 [Trichonephila clavipes]